MAGRDNVLFHATIASGTSAGTVVPLSLLYGIENVRQGYGAAKLKNVRAVYNSGYSASNVGVPIEIKNSSWIDSAGLLAVKIGSEVAFSRSSLSFMRGRDKELQPNTAFTITATVPSNTTSAMDLYVILEIEYSGVEGFKTEDLAGSPVMKKASNASVTGNANTLVSMGSFDNLLQGVEYILSEVSITGSINEAYCYFLVMEGFSNQKGLTRIFPIRNYGVAEQIEGSVKLTKQTYNLAVITSATLSATALTVNLEMVASKN